MNGRTISILAVRMERLRRGAGIASVAACAAFLVLTVLGPSAARAVVFPDLYRLTVTPEAGAGQNAASALAMRALLTRLTGIRDPAADADLARLIADSGTYVSYFGRIDQSRTLVEFYSGRVEQALESLGKPVWGEERPLTLLWIAIDGGAGERVLLSDSGIVVDGVADTAAVGVSPQTAALAEAIRAKIAEIADERGLPIRYPLLDLEDLLTVPSADIWGGFDLQVEAASQRYGADAILIGRIRASELDDDVKAELGIDVGGELDDLAQGLLGGDLDDTLVQDGPTQSAPVQDDPRQNAPVQDGPRQGMPLQSVPGPSAPMQSELGNQAPFFELGDGVQWTLVHRGERTSYGDPSIAEGIHWLADRYIQAYGFVGGARPVRLVVRNVSTLDDYGRVVSYLEGLSALQSVDVEAYERDSALLSLRATARADIAVLEQTLGLGRVLSLDEQSSSPADNTLVLTLAGGSRP
jgi:hypothetical protein